MRRFHRAVGLVVLGAVASMLGSAAAFASCRHYVFGLDESCTFDVTVNGTTVAVGVVPGEAGAVSFQSSASGPVRIVECQGQAGVEEEASPSRFEALGPSPNPCRGDSRLLLRSPAAGSVRIRLFDVSGADLGWEESARIPAGSTTIPLSLPPRLGNGVYWMRIESPAGVATRKVMLLRD